MGGGRQHRRRGWGGASGWVSKLLWGSNPNTAVRPSHASSAGGSTHAYVHGIMRYLRRIPARCCSLPACGMHLVRLAPSACPNVQSSSYSSSSSDGSTLSPLFTESAPPRRQEGWLVGCVVGAGEPRAWTPRRSMYQLTAQHAGIAAKAVGSDNVCEGKVGFFVCCRPACRPGLPSLTLDHAIIVVACTRRGTVTMWAIALHARHRRRRR